MAVTLKQIAREVGVSQSVVSQLLRDDPTLRVSDEMRSRILDVVKQKGGRRALRNHRRRIAYPINRSTWSKQASADIRNSQFYKNLQRRLSESGLRLEIVLFDPGEETETIKRLCSSNQRYEGLLIDEGLPPQCLESVPAYGFPHVTVAEYPASLRLNTVIYDPRYGITKPVEYLISLGHRRIGYLGLRRHTRFALLVETLVNAELPVDNDWFCFLNELDPNEARSVWQTLAREPFDRWFNPKTGPTAIICGNDFIAYGAVEVLERRGLTVGEDLSLVGYDNSEKWEGLGDGVPRLTTIDRSTDIVGQQAAELLINQIVHHQTEIVYQGIPTEFIVRESTGPCRACSPVRTAEAMSE